MPKRHDPGSEMSAAECLRQWLNRRGTKETVSVEPSQKWAIVFLPLHASVDQGEAGQTSEDYVTLRNAIAEVQGIQPGIKLILDGQVDPELMYDGDATIEVTVVSRDDTKAPE